MLIFSIKPCIGLMLPGGGGADPAANPQALKAREIGPQNELCFVDNTISAVAFFLCAAATGWPGQNRGPFGMLGTWGLI